MLFQAQEGKEGKEGKKELRKPRETMAGKECLICFEDLPVPGRRGQAAESVWALVSQELHQAVAEEAEHVPGLQGEDTDVRGETLEDRNQHGLFEYYDTVRCQACNSGERYTRSFFATCDVGTMGCLDPPLTELPQTVVCPECEPHQPGYSARENEQPAESDTDESVTPRRTQWCG